MMRTLYLIVLLALSMGAPAAAKSVHQEFVEAWTARDQSYGAEYASLTSTANSSIRLFAAATDRQASPEEVGSLFHKAMDHVFAASVMHGRNIMLHQLQTFTKKKPSAAAGELWLQERLAELQRRAVEAQRLGDDVESARQTGDFARTVGAIQEFVQMAGMVKGAADELGLIDQNLASYFQGRAAQSAERAARFRAMLVGMGQALQANAQQQASAFTGGPITTRCRPDAFGVTCTSQ